MPRSAALCAFKKKTRRFKSYHRDWFDALRSKLLPRLGCSLSSSGASLDDLTANVSALLHHFQTYYAALNRAATPNRVPFILSPQWRGPLEISQKPFLFLGDLHPYLFTNLIRSFLDYPDEDGDNSDDYEFGYSLNFNKDGRVLEKQWQIANAWKNSSESLKPRIEEIERGLRLMVPALLDRVKAAQIRFVDRVTEDWPENDPTVAVEEAASAEMEELARVFKDANRLRQSTVLEIVGALTAYEAALFLQALAQFVVGLGS